MSDQQPTNQETQTSNQQQQQQQSEENLSLNHLQMLVNGLQVAQRKGGCSSLT